MFFNRARPKHNVFDWKTVRWGDIGGVSERKELSVFIRLPVYLVRNPGPIIPFSPSRGIEVVHRVSGQGFRDGLVEFRIQDSEFEVQILGFRVYKARVRGLGFRF